MLSSLGFRTTDTLIALCGTATGLRSFSLKMVPELQDGNLAKFVRTAVNSHKNLRTLRIESYDLGLATCEALACTLKQSQTLKALRLSLCPSMDDVLPLIKALQSPRAGLEELVFHVDYLSERLGDRKHFLNCTAEMLRTNYTLKCIRGISWGATHTIIPFYLQLNHVGRARLLGSDTAQPKDWIDTLIANRHDTRVVHYLLLSNPTICTSSIFAA
ncbi:expressed unknown protein [Seminavis robusta]|uniref:RNI-like protein n=1 Tax=Seminavis robusta TaxID=568900 RepID=A0A9N8E7J5_9STRA|nr:expressed unknown protein [Seminavis robusta]|eukprot:Sro753_g197280.1 n/a (216) ;mRNA; r:4464-5111